MTVPDLTTHQQRASARTADRDPLARRYARLLVAYPPEHRRTRGPELVGTLLDLARPGQRWPTAADAVDLLASGVRARGAPWRVGGIADGARIAAPIAVALAAGVSAFLGLRVEPVEPTVAPVAYLAWVLAAFAWLTPWRRPPLVVAVATTLAAPFLATATGRDRPALWVTMSLAGFGVIALAGSGPRRSWPERLPVPLGAAVIALASAVEARGLVGGYYWPTVSVLSGVVALGAAATAGVALWRLATGRPAAAWLWATLLLAVPGGSLGPTGSDPGHQTVSAAHFGHLADVALATAIAVCAYDRFGRAFTARAAAGFGLGAAGALLAFAAATGGLSPGGWLPVTVAALLVAALAAAVVGGGIRPAATASAFAATCGVAPLIGAYDNGWTLWGWPSPRSTSVLVATVALVPLALIGVVAWRSLRSGGRRQRGAATLALAVAVAWCGRLTLPHVLRWGVALLVLVVVAVLGTLLAELRSSR